MLWVAGSTCICIYVVYTMSMFMHNHTHYNIQIASYLALLSVAIVKELFVTTTAGICAAN